MRTLDKVRQSIDIIFLYGLTAGLIMAITAIILAKLPE
jgi:tetrahydromethanopterin S-methyltransferase subunit G